jgi:hypothetical protein
MLKNKVVDFDQIYFMWCMMNQFGVMVRSSSTNPYKN